MKLKRRYFLVGGAAALGAGMFGLWWGDGAAVSRAKRLTAGKDESSFAGWFKIGADDTVTVYSPHIDFGQGSHTALAVKGVEKVISLDDAVVVVASGYWPALKGARALAPKFSDGGHGDISSASIHAAQTRLIEQGKPDKTVGSGDLAAGFATPGAKQLSADYRVPFLHHATMEPFAMTGHHKDGRLEVWGGTQDPLQTRGLLAKFAGLSVDDVTFHPMIMGGGFGRRFPPYTQIIEQIARVAMQVDYPVKIIWSREEDVKQGAYRPQSSARLKAALGPDGKILAWQTDYAQWADAAAEVVIP